MKTVIFLMLGLFSVNSLLAQKVAPEVSKFLKLENARKKPVVVEIDLEWGKKREGCRGMGICDADIVIKNKGEQHQLIGYGQNKLAIVVLKSKMSQEKLKENFSTNKFVLEQDFVFSNAISEKFKAGSELSGKLKLNKDSYALEELENYFIIYK